MNPLLCRDLKPGDIFLKMATNSLTHKLIKFVQSLAGQPNAFPGHAALALDTQLCIEAQAAGSHNLREIELQKTTHER